MRWLSFAGPYLIITPGILACFPSEIDFSQDEQDIPPDQFFARQTTQYERDISFGEITSQIKIPRESSSKSTLVWRNKHQTLSPWRLGFYHDVNMPILRE
jgi:hypothetical protein